MAQRCFTTLDQIVVQCCFAAQSQEVSQLETVLPPEQPNEVMICPLSGINYVSLSVMSGWQDSQIEGLSSWKIGYFWGTRGELCKTSGELLGNLWIALRICKQRSSWEVARGTSCGKFGAVWEDSARSPKVRDTRPGIYGRTPWILETVGPSRPPPCLGPTGCSEYRLGTRDLEMPDVDPVPWNERYHYLDSHGRYCLMISALNLPLGGRSARGGYCSILGGANLPEQVSRDMGYRSSSIVIFFFPYSPTPPIPTNPPSRPSLIRSISGPFRSVSGPFRVRFGSVSGPFRVRFGSVSGRCVGSGGRGEGLL